jgi:hypothetical protein
MISETNYLKKQRASVKEYRATKFEESNIESGGNFFPFNNS